MNLGWTALRVLVLVGLPWELVALSRINTDMSWLGCAIIVVVVGTGLFLWFIRLSNRQSVDWSEPLSLTRPFLPMSRNPVQFWSLVAAALTIGGAAAGISVMASGKGQIAFAGTFFFTGVAISLALAFARSQYRIRR
jgi:hypothetical protein